MLKPGFVFCTSATNIPIAQWLNKYIFVIDRKIKKELFRTRPDGELPVFTLAFLALLPFFGVLFPLAEIRGAEDEELRHNDFHQLLNESLREQLLAKKFRGLTPLFLVLRRLVFEIRQRKLHAQRYPRTTSIDLHESAEMLLSRVPKRNYLSVAMGVFVPLNK
ncbi:hypothetical protein KC338_g262 [Hortaea werneckii]|nr:hypothetical protein KC338_g262 [Hortaea werneckii]